MVWTKWDNSRLARAQSLPLHGCRVLVNVNTPISQNDEAETSPKITELEMAKSEPELSFSKSCLVHFLQDPMLVVSEEETKW